MTPTLALEQLMLHPQYDQFVDALREATPTHIVDQADAAALDAHQLMTAVAHVAIGETNAHTVNAAGVPGWLRLPLLDTLTAWVTGQARTCRHQPDPRRPQPVLTAAWMPGLIVCPACAHLTALPRASARDRTCDACGRVCAGIEHDDGIYPGMVQLGPMIYQYGTCGDCNLDHPTENSLRATESQDLTSPRGTARVERRTKPRTSRGRGRGRKARR